VSVIVRRVVARLRTMEKGTSDGRWESGGRDEIAEVIQIVGIAELKVSNAPSDVLATYALGSCLGITAYDPALKAGGMAHCLLPLSHLDPVRAENCPALFTDTGVSALIQAMLNLGACRDRLVVKVAGGASPLNDAGVFRTGARNYVVMRKLLWKNGLLIAAEDVGGAMARSMRFSLATGAVHVTTGGREVAL